VPERMRENILEQMASKTDFQIPLIQVS